MPDGWGKIKPVARYAGISERLMRRWLREGLVHSRLPSGLILIKFSDLDAYLESFRADGAAEIDQIVNAVLKR